MPAERGRKLISIVVPAFNESAGIQETARVLAAVMDGTGYRYEIVVVDDGSTDGTFDRVAELGATGAPVYALRLSRNFGKEAALLAGLRDAGGDAVITIDADLQHPPALIPEMIAAWENGAKIVHGVKRNRGNERWLVGLRARVINRLIKELGGIDVRNSSDFKLLDRVAVDVLAQSLPEHKRFYRGLTKWIGLPQASVKFNVAARQAGVSRWRLRALLGLSTTALVSFSSAPLRIVAGLGLVTLFIAVVVGGEAIISRLQGRSVSGFATIIITLLLIGSFIMISLGIIGEYVAKIYEEVKSRPLYLVHRSSRPSAGAGATPSPGGRSDAGEQSS